MIFMRDFLLFSKTILNVETLILKKNILGRESKYVWSEGGRQEA